MSCFSALPCNSRTMSLILFWRPQKVVAKEQLGGTLYVEHRLNAPVTQGLRGLKHGTNDTPFCRRRSVSALRGPLLANER